MLFVVCALCVVHSNIAGFAGSAPIAVGGGSVSDLFSEQDRAAAMAAYTMGPLIGPAIGKWVLHSHTPADFFIFQDL
jgi:MFS family permease